MLYGRATETAAIGGLLSSAASGQGGALVLRGEAGVGKSALLDLAAATAAATTAVTTAATTATTTALTTAKGASRPPGAGMRVLRASGVEPEADLAFAALHQLLHPVTGLLDALPAPQRDAVAGALGLAAPTSDRFLVSAGVLSLLTEAAAPGGLACLVDDVQWFDRASADALLFAARRLRAEGIAMLLAVRGDAPLKGLPELRVRGLDADSAGDLLASRATVAPAVRAHLAALSGGNPLVLRETTARLTPDQLSGRAPLPDPLPGGEQLFGEQVSRLSEAARLVLLVATLDAHLPTVLRASPTLAAATLTPTTPTTLAPVVPPPPATPTEAVPGTPPGVRGTPPDGPAATTPAARADGPAGGVGLAEGSAGWVAEALREAETAELVFVEGAAVRFRHPLVRSAVHVAAGSVRLRQAHAALATLASGDRRAWHLAAASLGPDESVAAALAASAVRARARGGYGDAATALARAAELTPDPAPRAERLKDAATAAWLAGRPGLAQSHLSEARDLAEHLAKSHERDPRLPGTSPERPVPSAGEPMRGSGGPAAATPQGALLAEIAQLRGRFELNSGDAAEAVRILSRGDTLEMLADASEAASYVGDVPAIVELGRRALAHPRGFLRDTVAGIGAVLGGDPGGAELLRAALDRTGTLTEAAEFLWASAAASYLGEADLSAELVGRAGGVARMSGMVGQLPVVLEFVSTAERFRGRLAESAAIAEEGLALAREAGYTNSVSAHLANLAVVAALRGEEEACRRHAEGALAIAIPHRVGLRAGVAAYALAMLDLGQGRFAAAHDRFVSITTAGPGAGHPTVVWRSTPDRVEAAMAAGEFDAAREAVSWLERWSANAGTAESRALLARCRALVGGGDELFEEALSLHGEPFEGARTALLYGERLRRTQRPGQARPHLRAAMETFQRLGAEPWARRAHGELRAAGESAARPDAGVLAGLTPQELRIARLVADGASSKEVAAQLFLSPRTVEYHLYKIYPKLGITSRTELARLL
ncbi:LuxR C-terminal-related transcriptional regulator [Nonomuraea muscovyensis]|uniref:helix-turn-helix transcriptional regulator n=1 Tax=Nonomuraea muscovyensis TaxID=1124761 RepID=UPI0033E8B504